MFSTALGADILDSTNQNAYKFGILEEQDTWFDLSPNQRKYFDSMRHINSYLREEFHAIQVRLLVVNVEYLVHMRYSQFIIHVLAMLPIL